MKSWAKLQKFPGKIYSDKNQPNLPAFAALGANFKGKPQTCCRVARDAMVGTVHALNLVVCGCHFELTAGVTKQNVLVQAGVIALDDGRVVFKQMQESIDQPLPTKELIEMLHQLELANQQ